MRRKGDLGRSSHPHQRPGSHLNLLSARRGYPQGRRAESETHKGREEGEREEPELRNGDGGLLRLVTRGSGNCRCVIISIVVVFFSFFFAMEAGVRSNLW
jgi:hypothetical protein